MGSVTEEEGVLLYRILSSSSSASSDEWNPTDTVIFFGLSLGLGIACRHVLRGTRVPYTVALFVIGIALGSLEYGTSHQLGRIGDGIRLWAHIDPDLLLAVFLPALLFESSFSMDVHQIKGHAWGYLFLLYIFVLLSRFVVVGVLYPFLRYFGYGLDWKEATILIWSGLRGAVALSLSLSVKASNDSSMYLSSETGTLFVFFTGGIVLLTLIVNGSTTQFILHLLGMDRLSATKKRILNYTKYEMLNRALEAFGDLGDDEELGPVDWPTVKTYIASLNNLDGSFEHPYSASESGNNLDPNNLKDIRIRLLNGGNDIASIVINESEAEGEEARKFLEDVRVAFPQESAIVLTKLLLPQVFEEMPMQELRVLVAQRSVITTYIRGETIEVPHHSLGFLLEGFVKAHGFQELIASPAVLLPLQGNQSSQNIEISVDRPNRPLTREHGGLMSWPENFYRPREHKPNCEGTYLPVNSLSARAMQLSIFGSMVNIRRRAHSFSSSQVKRSHSMSVLRMASFRNRQQVPVPSEGDTDTRMSLEVRDLIEKTPAPQLHSAGTNETHTIDNYSDESDAEDEIVVRIDSPSRLSFHQES
uniref:Na+/H+ antiporter n=1 Tax=Populus pruinosa TaxID=492479 RepID=A0A1S5VAJ7_9ROSI|nr:Na+/H+ antiporter [Populus pruinosa]AQN76654.1 Na+/H+ antiporter [Populus pruinosa]AQN76655.1 Na+/H+ antiporter [Populus pruinosa]AQN76656.1 Na+/H+ antiporter [Populus pruinosa]AQN76662.1 Na+/H+ antiporter [Populus pruinosa]